MYILPHMSMLYVYVMLLCTVHYMYIHVHDIVLMRDEREGRKKQARSNKQQGKATQHTHTEVVTFPNKNELPWVGETRRTCTHVPMKT